MPLIIDPALQASVVRQFNLRGELAPFNLTENVVPIFDIGTLLRAVDPTVVTTAAGFTGVRPGTTGNDQYLTTFIPVVEDTGIFNSGATVNPGAAQVLVDTGQRSAGPMLIHWIINNNAAISDFDVQWRNAADAATLATWTYFAGTGQPSVSSILMNLDMALNERIRIVTGGAVVGTVNATISVNPSISASIAV